MIKEDMSMNEELIVTKSEGNFTVRRVIYYILGVIEVLLGARLIFRLLGANASGGFISFIYSLTKVFVAPFALIFSSAVTEGLETKAVLEPGTIIAMIVYAVLAWGIVKLIIIMRERKALDSK